MKQCINRPVDKISFVERFGSKVYAEYGKIKTYTNRTQANNKIQELRQAGYSVFMSLDYPFTIIEEVK
jgi:hypothetical protein